MKIGIDIDDVLANFVDRQVEILNEMYGKPAIGSKPVDWACSNYGLTKEEYNAVWDVVKKITNFHYSLDPLPEVDERLLYALANKNNDLYFITSRVPNDGPWTVTQQSARWIQDALSIDCPQVLLTSKKGEAAKLIGLDYFIDDRDKNCIEVKEAVPTCEVYINSRSHNLNFDNEKFGIKRVENFNEFAKKILEQ